jgi:uncharacterized protein YggE
MLKFVAGGLLARAVQHGTDHLNGILFIDRMERKTKEEFRDELDALQAATKAELAAAATLNFWLIAVWNSPHG